MFVRAYLRASTDEQDASRARQQLEDFATERGLVVAAWYVENESGAALKRPELFRLLNDCHPGDVLLTEQVDRLSRLNESDWEALKREIGARGVRVVSLDLPTSWASLRADDFTNRMLGAINGMLLDMLAAVARKDYEDRRRRAAQGVEKAKARAEAKGEKLYKGRKENVQRNANILASLERGDSWGDIQKATGCSRSTIKRVKDRAAGTEVASS